MFLELASSRAPQKKRGVECLLSGNGNMRRFTSLLAALISLFCAQSAFAQSGAVAKSQKPSRATEYSKLPPQERVRLWLKQGGFYAGYSLEGIGMQNELIVRGLDTVPYLAEIVRGGNGYERLGALSLLCKMDRFVPAQRLPEGVPGRELFGGSESVGILDNLMIVDGRRIGQVGIEAVRWASEQTKQDDLRFHAREYSGLLNEDLRKLSYDEQFAEWRKSAAKCKGYPGMNDDCKRKDLLGDILREKMPETLSRLIEIVEHDPNAYVREEAISLIAYIDKSTVRLRATENGRRAIEAIQQAVLRCKQKPNLDDREDCDDYWQRVSSQFFDDIDAMSLNWIEILDTLYGLQLKEKRHGLQSLSPEGRRFVTYLTQVDPNFPGWEFPHHSWEYVMHPRFRTKWQRYYEQWKRFKASQDNPVPTSNGT